MVIGQPLAVQLDHQSLPEIITTEKQIVKIFIVNPIPTELWNDVNYWEGPNLARAI